MWWHLSSNTFDFISMTSLFMWTPLRIDQTRPSLVVTFGFHTLRSGEIFPVGSAKKLSVQSFALNLQSLPVCFFWGRIQSSSSFSASAKHTESLSVFNSPNLCTSQIYVENCSKVLTFCVLKDETSVLASTTSDNALFHWYSFLKTIVSKTACVFG